jgi:uncharacterized protein involved in outer membrane biogenesis
MFTPPNRALRYGVIACSVVAAIVLVVLIFPWNVLRGPLAAYASARLDRPVAIDGDLKVDLGWITRVQIDGVSVANATWSDDQPMVASKHLVLWFTVPSLLRGEPVKAQLVDTRVSLERNAGRDVNWHFGSSELTPRLSNVEVERGVVRIRDAISRADVTLQLQTVDAAAEGRSALRVNGAGTLQGEAVKLEATSLGLAQLQDIDDPYRLTLKASVGRTTVNFNGTIVPAHTENVSGALHLEGPDLSKLYPVVPAPLPSTPPYNLSGELTHTNHVWNFRGIHGRVGESDLKGDFRIDVSKPRSMMTADLTSARFDSKDLGGFIGLPPGEPWQRLQTSAQQTEARRRELSYRVLPDKPLELTKLREHDADVRFHGTSVKWSAIPMDNLAAHMTLKDGVLRFDPLDFGIADGHVIASGLVDVTHNIAHVQGDFEAHNVELKRLFPKLASPQGTAGRFGGRGHFRTQGNTIAAMLAAVDGDAAVIMRGGEASALRLVLTNLDLARAAELLLRGDEAADIRCAIGELHATDGVLTPNLLVVDTSAVVITGQGNVDFREEKYDLALNAKSKHPSLLALRGPIMVRGTFKAPVVGPAVGPVATRVGAAVGLGAIAPPLALLPLIDFGGASDVDCRALIEQARANTSTSGQAVRSAAAERATPRSAN